MTSKLQNCKRRFGAISPVARTQPTRCTASRYWTDVAGKPAAKSPSLDALDAVVAQDRIAVAALADGTRIYHSIEPNNHDDAARRERSRTS